MVLILELGLPITVENAIPPKLNYPIVERDPVLVAEYKAAKTERSIQSFEEINKWPDGLQERFTRRLEIASSFAHQLLGTLFETYLVSSWVEGSGVDEFTEFEEPEFWDLKYRYRTWDGRALRRHKFSDYDINTFLKYSNENMRFQGLWLLKDNDFEFKLDLYPCKGERKILLNQ